MRVGMDRPPQHASPVPVTALSYGPHAIARQQGKVMFVRGAVPGDEVILAVREERRSYAYADVVEVVHASPDRRHPPCPYLPQCGGCPWQQISYRAQLRAKERNLRDQLSRALDLTQVEWRPILPAPAEFGYRHRLSLRVDRRRVGFFAGGTHRLVPVTSCLLAEPALTGVIPAASEWIGRLDSDFRRLETLVAVDGERWVLLAEAQGALAARDRSTSESFLAAHPRLAGLVLRGKRTRWILGEDRCGLEIEPGLPWVVHAGTFTQVTRAGNRALLQSVLDAGQFRGEQHVLDLFAGAGNLSLPIARRVGRVVAVERGELAVADGIANARDLGLGHCEFRCASAQDGVEAARRRGEHFDVVVLDPPRSGAVEVMAALCALAAQRVVYVSCDPATLARDLRAIASRYRIERVQPIDLFPQTYHVETVVTAILA